MAGQIDRKKGCGWLQISCQKHKLKLIFVHYIYHKKWIGQTPEKGLALLKMVMWFFLELLGLSISATFLSYPAHSIEGVLNMRPHRFHNCRFFQLLILNHTVYKKIYRLRSFRDKSPWITSFSNYIECLLNKRRTQSCRIYLFLC